MRSGRTIPHFPDRSALETGARAGAEAQDDALWVDGRVRELKRCRMLAGPWVYVDPRDVEIAPHLMRDGFWEAWLTLAVLRALRPGDACVDVGANVGYYALLMADVTGGRVLAVEPNPDLAVALAFAAQRNGFDRLEVRQVAAGAARGEADLVVRHAGDGRRRMGGASLHFDRTLPADVHRVRVEPLDALLADWPRVDFVKVDAEGAELDVWRGMQRTLDRHPDATVLMEVAHGRGYDLEAFCREVGQRYPLRAVSHAGWPELITTRDVAFGGRDEGGVLTLWLSRR